MVLEQIVHGPLVQVHEGEGEGVAVSEEAWVGVGSDGRVDFAVSTRADLDAALDAHDGSDSARTVDLPPGSILFPGLVDAHLHAPQYAFLGIGTNWTLIEWLNKYTFPFESRCADAAWAERVYGAVVRRTLRAGTTTAAYFATIHSDASETLARTALSLGQRAYVGKVSMDRNGSPTYVEPSTAAAIADAESFVDRINALGSDRVLPILTPRFVPACTAELMQGIAGIARRTGAPVQTHISENPDEISWVRSLHPECSSYADVYARYGLLTPRTLCAHGVYLGADELALLRDAGSSVVHCPLSNYSLCSGVCDVRKLQAAGVNVALGTDISGGGCASMFSAMQMALVASQSRAIADRSVRPLGWRDVLRIATLGGARALGASQDLGGLTRGKYFDAMVVQTSPCDGGVFDTFGWESIEELAEKVVITGDDRVVRSVYVHGKEVVCK
eukprot:m51a1_g14840 guanine deaminase, putative (446) ;mRNA; f:734498-736492